MTIMQAATTPKIAAQAQDRAAVAGAPQNVNELQALIFRKDELQRQLRSVTERRRELTEQMQLTGTTGRGDLQARLKGMDDRAARLEREIVQAEDGVADALGRGLKLDAPPNPAQQLIQKAFAEQPVRRGPDVSDAVALALFFEVIAFVLMGAVFWRFWWKPALAKLARPTSDSARIDQLQQSVDVIAVEVERIAEGQRYVAKQLDERQRIPISSSAPS